MNLNMRVFGFRGFARAMPLLAVIAFAAPIASGAVLDSHSESFASLSGIRSNARLESASGVASVAFASGAEEELRGATTAATSLSVDEGFRGAPNFEPLPFGHSGREARDGGGWVEHGGFNPGGLGEGHECENGCVGVSAVPEPGRLALIMMGLLAVVVLAKGKVHLGSRLALAR